MKASDLCAKAGSLVGGDREKTHGSKTLNHGKITVLWNGYLAIRRDPASPLTSADVAHMLVLLKTARTQLGAFNADDWIDMVGYAACAGEIAHELHDRPTDD